MYTYTYVMYNKNNRVHNQIRKVFIKNFTLLVAENQNS